MASNRSQKICAQCQVSSALILFLLLFLISSTCQAQNPGDTKVICSGDVPQGWVCTAIGSYCNGDSLAVTSYSRTIEYTVGLPAGSKIDIIDDVPPPGWAITQFGVQSGIGRMIGKTIYYYETITKYDGLPPGATLTIINTRAPTGWATIDVGSTFMIDAFVQTRQIMRLDGDSVLNELTIVDELAPAGWIPTWIGEKAVGNVIYETRQIRRISSMDPSQEYTLAQLEVPLGWFATSIENDVQGTTSYQIFKIDNLLNMPAGTVITIINTMQNPSVFPPEGWNVLSTGRLSGIGPNYSTVTIKKIRSILSGPISGELTKAGSPYFIDQATDIEQGESLRIDPGVHINAQTGSDQFSVTGRLVANGTAQDSIYFNGIPDTSAVGKFLGGNLNFFAGSTGSAISYISINGWGSLHQSPGAAIYVDDSGVSITHCRFNNCNYNALYTSDNSSPFVQQNDFHDSVPDISPELGHMSRIINNTNARIYLRNYSTISADTVQLAPPGTSSVYVIQELEVNKSAVLTVMPGTHFQWSGDHSGTLTVAGTLIAKGNDQDSIHFDGPCCGLQNPLDTL
ncbi:MAG: hypothetical protein JST32_03955, partial [Bacteroidetes bacterium]|nr:hypothetical protein [Bacteroidota bacterium]